MNALSPGFVTVSKGGSTTETSLIETIAKIDKLSTFSRLMETSGVNEAFSAGGEFTVFAPTNDAFRKINDGRMKELLHEPELIALKSILSYHILPGKFSAAELFSRSSAATITDVHVKFTDSRTGLMVNDSGVESTDIEAANGVVHILDTVLDHDVARSEAGALKGPEAKPAAESELYVQRLPAGGRDEDASGQISKGDARTARSGGLV